MSASPPKGGDGSLLILTQQKTLDKLVGASHACSSIYVGVTSSSSPDQELGENYCISMVNPRQVSSLCGPTEGPSPLKLSASQFSSPHLGLGLARDSNCELFRAVEWTVVDKENKKKNKRDFGRDKKVGRPLRVSGGSKGKGGPRKI